MVMLNPKKALNQEVNMLKQIVRSNNNWLWAAKNFSSLDLFEGISNKKRQEIYNATVTIKNTLFETDFEEIPENFETLLIGRMYESIRRYAYRYHSLNHPLMPSTEEAMFIIAKILYRTAYIA